MTIFDAGPVLMAAVAMLLATASMVLRARAEAPRCEVSHDRRR
ncbi:hypothetical protein FHS79_002539 [Polymorphobacter multimanifer]|uniref:Uncharacterized protein n=1 Tax=Polymorphobacter multimanifer TaxID=1070431 RepID=A0A841L6Y3_9SPHN|nr:hypothetical protein [Polymorphobacter multimanifer]MBB6228354.1 hypothetical protein [Polymorphobacter multimanifer]